MWWVKVVEMSFDSSLYKKRSFSLRISLVNVTKSTVSCGFDYIYWKIFKGKIHFLCSGSWKLLFEKIWQSLTEGIVFSFTFPGDWVSIIMRYTTQRKFEKFIDIHSIKYLQNSRVQRTPPKVFYKDFINISYEITSFPELFMS